MNTKIKVLLRLFLIGVSLYFGFNYATFAFTFGRYFYVPFTIIVTITLIVFINLWFSERISRKAFAISFSLFILVSLISVAGNELYNISIPTLSNKEVDLSKYSPYIENTKAVSLNEPSTYKISDNMPILDGATALYPLYSAFAQATYPEGSYDYKKSDVMCTNTIGAYDKLINGTVDIVFAARPSQQQLDLAKSKGIELKLTPIGREAFVFFVNSKNIIEGLTTEQIQGIYSGQITNWKDAGGSNESITAFQRTEGSGSQTMLQKLIEWILSPQGQYLVEKTGYTTTNK